ncbi:Ltp family lipoprotein, partial [Glutamicibacter ardleyensis]|uniref:Ltp family lipoprotein n=1 Tax=Glutamicibacter ardleyensis TaxID=225894 RepID=UPI003FCF1C6C
MIAAGAGLLGTMIFGEHGPKTTVYDAGTSGQTSAEPEVQVSLLGNENALSAAENYLSIGSFSQKALQEQLEIDGYTVDEASSALSLVTADWN